MTGTDDQGLIHRGKKVFVGVPDELVSEVFKLSGRLQSVPSKEMALTFCDDLKRMVEGFWEINSGHEINPHR